MPMLVPPLSDPVNNPRPDGKGGFVPGTPIFFYTYANKASGNWCRDCKKQDVGTIRVENANGEEIIACYDCFMKARVDIKTPVMLPGVPVRHNALMSCSNPKCIDPDADNRCTECGQYYCDGCMVIQGQTGFCKLCCDSRNYGAT